MFGTKNEESLPVPTIVRFTGITEDFIRDCRKSGATERSFVKASVIRLFQVLLSHSYPAAKKLYNYVN